VLAIAAAAGKQDHSTENVVGDEIDEGGVVARAWH